MTDIIVFTLLPAKSEDMIHLGCSIFQSVSPYVRQSEKLVHNSTEFHFFFSYFPTIPPYHTPPPPTTKITHPPGMVITPQTTIRDGRVRFFYTKLVYKKLDLLEAKIYETGELQIQDIGIFDYTFFRELSERERAKVS